MIQDRHGNPLTGATARAAELFDRAVEGFSLYRGDPVGLLDEAGTDAPDFAFAPLAKAALYALATEPKATATAATLVAHARRLPLDDRAASFAAALDRLIAGNWTQAALALDRHSMNWPRDLLALQTGHLIDFFRANARSLRDRIARALPRWPADLPGRSVVLGMHAFGLEECADYARAEAAGRAALDAEPRDCWAHHAVAHVMEMQGRAEDGIGWMSAREPHWSDEDNFFQVHNWWHRALFHLDLEQTDAVLALYDGPIRGARGGLALDLLDAAALLWRLEMTGHDVGDRWGELARAWDRHADHALYPFNDWHAAMAYLGAGRPDRVEAMLAAWRAPPAAETETAAWARAIALPLVEGFAAFHRGDYETAVARLHPARHIVNAFGGSHAQRDTIDWTLVEAALRGGLADVAMALAHERLTLKPHSPVNRAFLARATGTA